jgi:3',5'-cyclic AMP phosphodiesterase CpdA
MKKLLLVLALAGSVVSWTAGPGGPQREAAVTAATATPLPLAADSVKFAVIGDNGDGSQAQRDIGAQMLAARERFPFEFVIMLGDNIYGGETPRDFQIKFEQPYAALLERGVPFYAALGNHDDPSSRTYVHYNMPNRYFTFVKGRVRFFVLDTNLMDRAQIAWIEQVLRSSQDEWRIVYYHHPIYSNARRYGSNLELRAILEPLFTAYGVDVALSGHEHVYERHKPQKGVTYFVEGSSGKLRKGDVTPGVTTAAWFDQDQTFMVVEVGAEAMTFQTISRTGRIVDSGVIPRRPKNATEALR